MDTINSVLSEIEIGTTFASIPLGIVNLLRLTGKPPTVFNCLLWAQACLPQPVNILQFCGPLLVELSCHATPDRPTRHNNNWLNLRSLLLLFYTPVPPNGLTKDPDSGDNRRWPLSTVYCKRMVEQSGRCWCE